MEVVHNASANSDSIIQKHRSWVIILILTQDQVQVHMTEKSNGG